jgi:NAD(P)-dependent dehydrogenase (short-subunit alcohol dehydrogenase family)
LPPEQLERTLKTNVFGYLLMAKHAAPHLKPSSSASVVNTVSVEAYQGMPSLVPYTASKGAELSFTRSLAAAMVKKEVRVKNAVAPGPVLTSLVTPNTFSSDMIAKIKTATQLGRMAQPAEIAPAFVFLASAAAQR